MHEMRKFLAGVMLPVAMALAPCAASAQKSDDWKYEAQIYGVIPTIDGTANFPASGSVPGVSVDASKVLDALKMAFLGSFEAKKGSWGVFTDLAYLDLGGSQSDSRDLVIGGIPLPATASARVNGDFKATFWTTAVEYALVSRPGTTMDLFAGARMADATVKLDWGIDGNIGGIPTAGRTGERKADFTYWDAVVGIKGRWYFDDGKRWFVPYYLDVGAGQSDLTWQGMVGVGYSWKSTDLYVAYRYLAYEPGDDGVFADLALAGPMVSIAFRW